MWEKKFTVGGFTEGRSGYSKHNIFFRLSVLSKWASLRREIQFFVSPEMLLKCSSGILACWRRYIPGREIDKQLFHICFIDTKFWRWWMSGNTEESWLITMRQVICESTQLLVKTNDYNSCIVNKISTAKSDRFLNFVHVIVFSLASSRFHTIQINIRHGFNKCGCSRMSVFMNNWYSCNNFSSDLCASLHSQKCQKWRIISN